MIQSPSQPPVERFRSDCERLIGSDGARIGIAVSGGPDSLAVLLLAGSAFPGRIAAATIDHRLRPESAREARFVAELCGRLEIPHALLEVEVDPLRSSVQRAAREARYRALAGWCEREALGWLATAHHVDDQAETLLMRLMRGSGVAGLAGIRATGPLPGSRARLIRPVLGWRRSELAALLAAAGVEPVSDPSNRDPRYDRVRLRRELEQASWLEPVSLARSAAALAEAELALEWAADGAWESKVASQGEEMLFEPGGLPAEIIRRILVRLLGDSRSSPRGEEIQRLAETLAAGKTATLAGFRCSGGSVWRFARERPRGQWRVKSNT